MKNNSMASSSITTTSITSTTASPPPTTSSISLTSDEDISPIAYATMFALSSVVLILVITTACYNVFVRTRPTTPGDDPRPGSGEKRGLDEETLGGYPRMRFSEAKIELYGKNNNSSSGGLAGCCSICLGEYKEVDMVLLLPNCAHFFHVDCVDTWLRLRPTCPVCRNSPVVSLHAASGGRSFETQELGTDHRSSSNNN